MATTRIVTLNEILKLFKDFKDENGMLNDIGYGPVSDIGVSRQMEFPYLWITHQSDSTINIDNKTAIPDMKFVLLFMDQVNDQVNFEDINGEDSNNGQEILSDMLQVLQDCVTKISSSWGVSGVMLTESVRCFPAFEETPDKVNGWGAEITLRLRHVNCAIPT